MMTDSAPQSVEWLGTRYSILLRSKQTGSRVGVFESIDPPGSGPPRHIHRQEDETFHVQAGEVEFWMNGETVVKRPGSAVFVPRGAEHTFRVCSDIPARMLTVVTPGGFEGFFFEMTRNGYRIPENMEEIAIVGELFNLVFTGPPLSAPR